MQQQQQHHLMAACNPNNLTTDHIQLNKSSILKIVESRNSGKLSECAENQARPQRNLVYLSDIADSQPEPLHSQVAVEGASKTWTAGGGGGGDTLYLRFGEDNN